MPKVQVVEPALTPARAVGTFVAPFLKPIGTTALVIVFVIFMLLRLPDLRDRVIGLLGSKNLRVTTEALDEAAHKVSRYLVMQTMINGVQGISTAVGLYLDRHAQLDSVGRAHHGAALRAVHRHLDRRASAHRAVVRDLRSLVSSPRRWRRCSCSSRA